MLEPTSQQQSELDSAQVALALVQFLAVRDQDAFHHYRTASEGTVARFRGRRAHDVRIDQVLAGGSMPYRAITVDLFPSGGAARSAFDAVCDERQAALSDIYALIVQPVARLARAVKAMGFLAPLLSRILGTASEKDMVEFAELANPDKGPVPETVAALREHDQMTPFYMMNLNRFYPVAQYADGQSVPGEQAYNRYAARILPYLISVGGYPAVMGHAAGVFVGDERSQLHDDWSHFATVYYPSRRRFINLMTNSPRKGVYHRDAGLQRAVLMPSSDRA